MFLSTNFTVGGSSFRLNTTGLEDVFVANLDYSGVPLNGFKMGSVNKETFNDMGVDSFGNVYVSAMCGALPCACGSATGASLTQHFIARALTVGALVTSVGSASTWISRKGCILNNAQTRSIVNSLPT